MFLREIPINYTALLLGALTYYLIGALWYAPSLFGGRWLKHHEQEQHQREYFQKNEFYRVGSYVAEFIISLIIAYVLYVFIHFSGAKNIAEAITVAIWIWIGFIATTHFSAVLWARKTVKSFFIHATFMLLGLIAMAAIMKFLD